MSKKDALLNPQLARQLFFEFCNSLSESGIKVYTDGSKLNCSVGCAFVIPEMSIGQSWSLPPSTTIFNAELWALLKAINFIFTLDYDDAIIFCDSLSSLKAILNHHSSKDSILRSVINAIISCKSTGIRIRFVWIPSHINIPGNEEADKLANSCRTSPINGTIICPPTAAELLAKYKLTWYKNISDGILSNSIYPSISSKTKLGPLPWNFHSTRKFNRILHKLRSEHNCLNGHLSKIEPTISKHCEHGCPLSKENSCHILIDCPHYSDSRNALLSFFALQNISFTLDNLLGYNLSLPSKVHFKI